MNHLKYLTDHYDESIEKIKTIGAPLNFVFITDLHNRLNEFATKGEAGKYELAVNAIDSIQYILDRCPEISFVVNGGDIGNDYHPDPEQIRASHRGDGCSVQIVRPRSLLCGKPRRRHRQCHRPRQNDTQPFAILPEEIHRLCMKNNPTGENYYFFDHASLDYRFIFLNTSDKTVSSK
ncbi:MAG: hypothetical protein ACLR23_21645 [Clostridia bacterium]